MQLMEYIRTLESCLGREAKLHLMPMQPGDVAATFADTAALAQDVGYAPATPVQEGVAKFVEWYRDFYGV